MIERWTFTIIVLARKSPSPANCSQFPTCQNIFHLSSSSNNDRMEVRETLFTSMLVNV